MADRVTTLKKFKQQEQLLNYDNGYDDERDESLSSPTMKSQIRPVVWKKNSRIYGMLLPFKKLSFTVIVSSNSTGYISLNCDVASGYKEISRSQDILYRR